MAITDRKTGAVTYEGCVLEVGLQGMSFYDGYEHVWEALVWDCAKQETKRVGYGTTMGVTDDAVVDATPEVVAQAAAYRERMEAAARRRSIVREARLLARGKDVRVVRGRKVPIGTEGRIFWYGSTQYGMRVGIETATGERMFTAATNVEVILPADIAAMELAA